MNLRVLVVDDPELSVAIAREWRSRTESEVETVSVALSDVAEANRLPGDVIVFPAAMLGHFVERGLIRPLGETMINSESIAMSDIFPLTRQQEITWGGTVYALPLGSPQLVLAYRPDMLEKLGLAAPATWEEYQATVEKLADRTQLADLAPPADQPWRPAAEPTGPGFGGNLLLARAAAYASHHDKASPLFDMAKLDPLIDRPPYVRALTELAASVKASGDSLVASPSDALAELLAGRCGMALTWASGHPQASENRNLPPIAFAELPGSRSAFNFRQAKWEQRGADEDGRVPLLGMAGRLVAVTASTGQSAGAEGMTGWLSGTDVSSRLARSSSATTLFRASQRSALDRWVAGVPPAAGEQYFAVVQQTQSRAQWMSTVRLPGSHRYMAALDEAVRRTTADGQEPEASLREAADAWRKITAEIGINGQQAALSHSLGLKKN